MARKQPPPEQRALQFIRQHRLMNTGETLVVAVSGGPDSVCMLHILSKLQPELDIKLHSAHLNHRLRGAESRADAEYVAELAQRLGIPATIEERDVPAYRAEHRLSLEEAAREVRYVFLAEVAKKVGASRVAVGHTVDDHLETIIMHIIRGTGITGLRGLQPVTEFRLPRVNVTVVRPVLSLSREKTAEYCRQNRLEPCLDASNLWLKPLRNRVRLELLPLLKSYNPGVTDSLLRLSRLATDDLEYIDGEVTRLWDNVVRTEKGVIVLDKKKLNGLAPALQRQLLRRCIERLLGTLKDVEERHIEEIIPALRKPAGRRVSLPEGLTFAVEYDRYLLGTNLYEMIPFPQLDGVFQLNVPGETRIPGWRVEAEIMSRKHMPEMPQDNMTACFDLDRVGYKIEVRAPKTGDRFQPLGMKELKRVSEFMIDARIPRDWRKRVPVFSTPEQIIWVAGWRIDDRVKVTPETRRVLYLRMGGWDEERGDYRGEAEAGAVSSAEERLHH